MGKRIVVILPVPYRKTNSQVQKTSPQVNDQQQKKEKFNRKVEQIFGTRA